MASIRRSARSRKANTRYTNDILDEEVKRILAPLAGSSSSESDAGQEPEDLSSASDFEAAQGDADVASEDEDDLSAGSDAARPSEGSELATPAETDDEILSVVSGRDSDIEPVSTVKKSSFARPVDPKDTHNRGLYSTAGAHAGKEVAWEMLYGSAEEDLLPIVYTRDTWLDRDNLLLPSRKSLRKLVAEGPFGKSCRWGITEAKLRMEATKGWDWYFGDKGAEFRSRQKCTSLNAAHAQKRYLPETPEQVVLLGPLDHQSQYSVPRQKCLDFGSAWRTKAEATADIVDVDSDPNQKTSEVSNVHDETCSKRGRAHEGWLFDVGCKVQSLAWAPNCNGTEQYLAVACSSTSSQRETVEIDNPHLSAMIASPPYPSNIQLWRFSASGDDNQVLTLNMHKQPKLCRVLCIDWGNPRQIEWCPAMHDKSKAHSAIVDNGEYVGLLATTWSDGVVRVLDIRVPKDETHSTDYVQMKSAAYTATPSSGSSIYTSVEWLSPTDIAISNSFGYIFLFSIASGGELNGGPASVRPYHVTPIPAAGTYILRMKACYPSAFPGILAFASAGGETNLLSFTQPHVDMVSAGRLRLPAADLAYAPLLRGHLVAHEDCLYFHPVRRFFNGITVGRAVAAGNITCLATSRWHTLTLFGTSSGEITASNTMRRILPGGRKYSAGGHWQQQVLKYDWIPKMDQHGSDQGSERDGAGKSTFHIHDPRPALSRFHEGFRPERVEMSRSAATRFGGKGKRKGLQVEGPMETIFEPENAVTALAWNPNLRCAGWSAVAFGSGMVRIEDLAWE